MLVSIICPTRKRVRKLFRMIESVRATAGNLTNYEVCLRVHSDDEHTLASLPEILKIGNVRIHIGPPLDWAHNVNAFDEARQIARGSWIAWMNDDCVIEGRGWDTQLWELPDRTIAIPETHRLGKSTYHRDRHIPFFFMPADSWGTKNFPVTGDTGLWSFYESQEWSVHWLTGITVWHDREESDNQRINEGL